MKHYLFACAALILISGCSSVRVSRDYDQSFDFSRLKTFAWKYAEQPETGNPRLDNDLMDSRIRKAINGSLESKGFLQAKLAGADFLVIYYMDYKQTLSGSSFSFGMGGGSYRRPHGYGGGIGYGTEISEHDEGVLTIDLVDSATQKTVWRGVGIRLAYDGTNPEKVSAIMNDAVARILAGFPPEAN